ncbi:MAG: hypothetical protein Q4B45_00020 [Coriobacteriia bacterium]|nr:hypothetical protein [Coriobacteriia bacterium]
MVFTNNKETKRANLHKAILKIVDDIRGAVDGWDFKTCIPCFLFHRFISEDLVEYIKNIVERECKLRAQIEVIVADLEGQGAQ